MTAKVAAHRLRAIAEAIKRGEVGRILADPQWGLTPEFRAWLEQTLVAADPKGLADEIEGHAKCP